MLHLARWIAGTSLSGAIRDMDWVVPLLQSLHILAIAMLVPSVLMAALRLFDVAQAQSGKIVAHRYAAWIWVGLAILATTGVTLIVAEPQRTLPNASFQIKLVLIALAVVATWRLLLRLRRDDRGAAPAGPAYKVAAVAALLLWCVVAAAGRFIAYTQPN